MIDKIPVKFSIEQIANRAAVERDNHNFKTVRLPWSVLDEWHHSKFAITKV